MRRPVVLEFRDDDTNDDHGAHHHQGSAQEHGLATDLVNDQLTMVLAFGYP